jgi:hypothetical protein
MKNDYYTYAYLRKDGTPYYIGKGRGKRAFSKARRNSPPPQERILFLKKNLTEEEAFRHEVYMIAVFGRKDLGTGILRNLTDGGEGASGKVVSEETRAKTRGKKRPPEVGEKIRQAKLGKKRDPETIRKMSEGRKGKGCRPCSEETKKKIGDANRGRSRPWSEERREKYRRKVAEGRMIISEETREKLRQASLLGWEKRRKKEAGG